MRIGVFTQPSTVTAAVGDVRRVADAGFASVWMPQIFGIDAITALTVAAHEVPDIELGTAVVPTFPRHPMMLAAQALTLQQTSGGRFTLGIGLSHQLVIEGMLGLSWDKPVRHLREYLSILLPLVRGEAADFEGETLTAKLALDVPEAAPVPVLVAALGSQMLGVAGRRAEGTVTWMTGPATIADHVAPTIGAAAADAGRPAPRIVCALPVCVTDDEGAARERAAEQFQMYGFLPSYRAMLDREGVAGPADVAIVGDAAAVKAGIERVREAGATEFVAVPYANRDATLEVLAELT
ncbi:TIGR03564 family F420-dependent LLM class oxidoreductase [Rhabdothermincola salaria]|uniref:TIGR03564 family F420-dependent LLM class oxidoreductase n=1 Tax=Rhabdothermincola salaria TaxID=2903142 RepID=UPI001E3094A1|nr:TIGR03564 family F420-dependent LLM class oxidoreductase [Rhabdothermincola salaria]